MPSKNMLPKGDRRRSVKAEYRVQRTLLQEQEAARRVAGIVAEEEEPKLHDTMPTDASTSPFAHVPGLITSGPSGGKHPQLEQSQPRYSAPRVVVEQPEIHVLDDLEAEDGVRSFAAEAAAAGMRLDAYLAKAIPDVSRARVQLLIEKGQVTVDGEPGKAKQKLRGGEAIEIEGEPQPEPLHATPEDIPLTIVYEDNDLAVIDKAAGMMVHAGAGRVTGEHDERNRGTLVNALLFHLGKDLSQDSSGQNQPGGGLRPGIVHRLDKLTSGLIVVAKNDSAHRRLSEMFAERLVHKVYVALLHGAVGQSPGTAAKEEGTVALPISRDIVRRTRMTTRRSGGRSAVSHWSVLERIDGPYGKFSLVEVRIETGRTHQIRVHMQALGHPVVGDALYGAPRRIAKLAPGASSRTSAAGVEEEGFSLERNFLHAAELEFAHPRTGQQMEFRAELPAELADVLQRVRKAG